MLCPLEGGRRESSHIGSIALRLSQPAEHAQPPSGRHAPFKLQCNQSREELTAAAARSLQLQLQLSAVIHVRTVWQLYRRRALLSLQLQFGSAWIAVGHLQSSSDVHRRLSRPEKADPDRWGNHATVTWP